MTLAAELDQKLSLLNRYTRTVIEFTSELIDYLHEQGEADQSLDFLVDARSNVTISKRGQYVTARLDVRSQSSWQIEASSLPVKTGQRFTTLGAVLNEFRAKLRAL